MKQIRERGREHAKEEANYIRPSYRYGHSEVAGDVGGRVPRLRDRPIGEADSGCGRAMSGVMDAGGWAAVRGRTRGIRQRVLASEQTVPEGNLKTGTVGRPHTCTLLSTCARGRVNGVRHERDTALNARRISTSSGRGGPFCAFGALEAVSTTVPARWRGQHALAFAHGSISPRMCKIIALES